MTYEESKQRDTRPCRDGWAPGLYVCICIKCRKEFCGDKRAMVCAPCAYAKPDAELTATPETAFTPEKIAELRALYASAEMTMSCFASKGDLIEARDNYSAAAHAALPAALDEIERLAAQLETSANLFGEQIHIAQQMKAERDAAIAERDEAGKGWRRKCAEVEAERDAAIADKAAALEASVILTMQRDAAIAERDELLAALQDIKDETTGWAHCVASSALSRQGLLDNSTRAALTKDAPND
jgi:hypothetical protein